MITRKQFIGKSLTAGLAASVLPRFNILGAERKDAFEVRQITEGPKQHWFGYYDKRQIDPTARYALGNEVDVIFRPPTAKDVLNIGLIDLKKGNKWTQIGKATSWGWQQGCMLQWIPGSTEEVIWNDRDEGDGFLSRVYNILKI